MLNFREELDVIKIKRENQIWAKYEEDINNWLKELLKEIYEKCPDHTFFSGMKLRIYLTSNEILIAEIVKTEKEETITMDSKLELLKTSYNLVLIKKLRQIFEKTWGYDVEDNTIFGFIVSLS